MTRLSAAAVTAVAALAITAAGCSQDTGGTPRPGDVSSSTGSRSTSTATTSSDQRDGPLLGLDPCSLITPTEAADLGAPDGGRTENLATSRGCGWRVSGSHSFGVAFFDTKGIDDLTLTGRRVPVTIGGRPAERLEESSGLGICSVLFPITDSSVVDVNVVADIGTAKACDVAERVARLIAPKLP